MTRNELWAEAIKAFNYIDNTTLPNPHTTDIATTYDLVAAMESTPPTAITYELEIALFGMVEAIEKGSGETIQRIAESHEKATSWDVQLQLRFPDTGQVEVLFEMEDLSVTVANALTDMLVTLFPDADQSVTPE